MNTSSSHGVCTYTVKRPRWPWFSGISFKKNVLSSVVKWFCINVSHARYKSQFRCWQPGLIRINLHGQALEVQNGSMQWARIHTMIGLSDRQLFWKANTCWTSYVISDYLKQWSEFLCKRVWRNRRNVLRQTVISHCAVRMTGFPKKSIWKFAASKAANKKSLSNFRLNANDNMLDQKKLSWVWGWDRKICPGDHLHHEACWMMTNSCTEWQNFSIPSSQK